MTRILRGAEVLGRSGLIALLFIFGVTGLAVLRASSVAGRELMAPPNVLARSFEVGLWCSPIAIFFVLVVELQLRLLGSTRISFSVIQSWFPTFWAVLGAIFAAYVLAFDQDRPKMTLLMAGGAFLVFLLATLHLALWQSGQQTLQQTSAQEPFVWYILAVALAAVFLGALHGWTTGIPYIDGVLKYRRQQYVERKAAPIPATKVDDDIPRG